MPLLIILIFFFLKADLFKWNLLAKFIGLYNRGLILLKSFVKDLFNIHFKDRVTERESVAAGAGVITHHQTSCMALTGHQQELEHKLMHMWNARVTGGGFPSSSKGTSHLMGALVLLHPHQPKLLLSQLWWITVSVALNERIAVWYNTV